MAFAVTTRQRGGSASIAAITTSLPVLCSLLLLLLCSSAMQCAAQQDENSTADDGGAVVDRAFPVAGFTSLSSCLPFNLLLSPGATPGVRVVAQQGVIDALNVSVVGDALYLYTSEGFTTNRRIRVNVTLPASSLLGVRNTGVGSVIVNPGFSLQSLTLEASGAGRVLATNLTTTELALKASGISEIYVSGAVSNATVKTSDAARAIINGLQGGAQINAKGASTITLAPTSNSAVIRGEASGLAKVRYTQGDCTVKNKNVVDVPFFSSTISFGACFPMDAEDLPSYRPQWSCGITVLGPACCAPDEQGRRQCKQSGQVNITITDEKENEVDNSTDLEDINAGNGLNDINPGDVNVSQNDTVEIAVGKQDKDNDDDQADEHEDFLDNLGGPTFVIARECRDGR